MEGLETKYSSENSFPNMDFSMRVLCQGGEEEGAVEPELEANKIDAEEQSSDSDYAEDQRMQLMAHMKAVRKHGGHVHG